MTKDLKNLIVGLDIGTSKVVAVVAEVLPDGRHEVTGLGQHESKGLKKVLSSILKQLLSRFRPRSKKRN